MFGQSRKGHGGIDKKGKTAPNWTDYATGSPKSENFVRRLSRKKKSGTGYCGESPLYEEIEDEETVKRLKFRSNVFFS